MDYFSHMLDQATLRSFEKVQQVQQMYTTSVMSRYYWRELCHTVAYYTSGLIRTLKFSSIVFQIFNCLLISPQLRDIIFQFQFQFQFQQPVIIS